MKTPALLFIGLLASTMLAGQPMLHEIKKYKIRSYTQTLKEDSVTLVEKKVFNQYGHDSLIIFNGKPAFYSKSETDGKGRLKALNFFNSRKDQYEELHQFNYKSDGSYTIEVIAHGAGLIDTKSYGADHFLLKSVSSDDVTTFYEYTKNGKLEKVYTQEKGEKKELVSLTRFDANGLELQTEIYREEPMTISYEHDANGMVSKLIALPKSGSSAAKVSITYQYEL